jgi:sec-independent protein translocase protein TatC
VLFPIAFKFFAGFQDLTGGGGVPIELVPKVGEYLDLVMKMIFACGLIFQMPVGISLLAKVGITSSKALRRMRRYAIVGMMVVAAIVAPPDPISMGIVGVPLILLYEISILAAAMVEKKPTED